MSATMTADKAGEPTTRIEQFKRFDIIKMMERASTRLFCRGEMGHASECAQVALYLRQDTEQLISNDEKTAMAVSSKRNFCELLFSELRVRGVQLDSPYFNDRHFPSHAAEIIASRIKELESTIASGQRALKRAKGRRK